MNNDPNKSNGLNNHENSAQSPPKAVMTSGELFVGANLIGKIGALFVIAGVIAFSAASKGYIPDGIRLVMVFAVGVIMLVTGELTYRNGSKSFSSALIFGGIAELFISGLIGYHGLEVLNGYTLVIAGILSAAIGIFLSLRYNSQALLVTTVIFSSLPIFSEGDKPFPFFIAAVYYIAVHCINAVISRKRGYKVSSWVGLMVSVIETLFVLYCLPHTLNGGAYVFSTVFILCAAVIYSSEPLFNAVSSEGRLSNNEMAQLLTIQSFALFFAEIFLWEGADVRIAGTVLIVIAVLLISAVIALSLRFDFRCGICTALINISLAAVTVGLMDVCTLNKARYIVMHIFAAGILVIGVLKNIKLFRAWGYALLCIAEFIFLTLFADMGDGIGQKLPVYIVNVAVWFGIAALFIRLKKHENAGFRAYSAAVLLNLGILLESILESDLAKALGMGNMYALRSGFILLMSAMWWLLLGFVTGKIKYMKSWGTVMSFCFYGYGLIMLLCANIRNSASLGSMLKAPSIIVAVIVNVISALFVLDIALKIESMAPAFSSAVGLVVSAYSLGTLTVLLGTNNFVKFTSFIISIIYIVTAAVWIIIGFLKKKALLRRCGLALVLLSSAKLFLFDFRGINPMGRTALFIGFGVTLLTISFGYGIAEKKFKQ